MGESIVWLLMVIYLGGDPVSVQRGEVAQTFMSEKACKTRIYGIKEKAEIPKGVNMGCIPYPLRNS
jgi:hypothetical protein